LRKKIRDEKRMSFLEHLEELRWRMLKSLAAVILFTIVAYIFSKHLLTFLTRPIPPGVQLIFTAPAGAFLVSIKVALIFGILASLPVIFYQFWKFVFPGLLDQEIKLAAVVIVSATFCFLLGFAFAYFIILPFGLRFLFSFQTSYLTPMPDIGSYIGFAGRLFIAFGIVFELPLLSFVLSKMGILRPQFLRRWRRYAITIIFILAAILTPPDVVTQILLALPLILLYEISILISAAVLRTKKRESIP
jgi:sec-independent protein translocase protein TatC